MVNSVIDLTVKDSRNDESYKIQELFQESSFKLFKEYCKRNKKIYLKDLENFDFGLLYGEKGFGKIKVESVIKRWSTWKEENFQIKSISCKDHKEGFIIHPCYDNMPIEALKALSIDPKIIQWLEKNHIKRIGTLRNMDLSLVSTIPNVGKSKYNRFMEGVKLLSLPEYKLYRVILKDIKNDEYFLIYRRRAIQKETLQSIADSKNISRERVRQLEMRIHNKLQGYFSMFSYYFIRSVGRKKIFEGEDIDVLFPTVEDRVIIKYALKNGDSSRISYFNEIKKYLVDIDVKEVIKKLNDILIDHIPEVFNYYEENYNIEQCLEENNLWFLDYDDFIIYIMNHGYKRYKDYIWKGTMKLSKCYSIIVKDYFKDGIKLSNEESIDLVRKVFKEKFGREDACENNRAIAARIESDNVLCNRGTYISPDYIDVPMELLQRIKQRIIDCKENIIFIADIYRIFEQDLLKDSNINNRYFLHGVLKYYYGDEFVFTKDNIVKDNNKVFTSHEMFEKFLFSKGKAVSKKEIRKVYPGWTDSMFNNAVALNKNILYWDNGYFINANLFKIKRQWTCNLKENIDKLLEKNNGYSNANMVFKEVASNMSQFIKENQIKNSFNLYSFIEYEFSNDYYFRRPHILKVRPKKQFTTMDLFYSLIENEKIICYDEFCEYFKNLEFTERTIYNAFHKVSSELIQIDYEKYALKKNFTIKKEHIEKIRDMLNHNIKDTKYIPLRGIKDFTKYPKMEYQWNSYLLESIVKEYLKEYRIIEKYFKDRRYKCSTLVKSDSNIENIADLIIYILKNDYKEELTLNRIQDYLQEKNVILKVLPKEVWDSEAIWVDKEGRVEIK